MKTNIIGDTMYEKAEQVLFIDDRGVETIGRIEKVWLDWKLTPVYNIRVEGGKWFFNIKNNKIICIQD